MTTCVREYRFVSKNLNSDPQSIKKDLSLLAFVSPGANSVTFQQRVDHDRQMMIQEAVGEAAAKMDKKATDLFIGGTLRTGNDALAALANWRLFGRLVSPDYDRSEMAKALGRYEESLNSIAGREWIERYALLPQVALNLLVECNDIISRYILIGSISTNVQAVIDGSPVHPKHFQDANLLSTCISTELFHAIHRLSANNYSTIPLVAAVLPFFVSLNLRPGGILGGGEKPDVRPVNQQQQRAPPPAGPAPGRGAGRGGGAPPNRDAGRGAGRGGGGGARLDDAAREHQKTKGFLTFTGTGEGAARMPPLCDVFVQFSGMPAKERICLLDCTKGFYCNRGTSCKQAHVSSFARIPAEEKPRFLAFVERTAGLSFVPGQAPPGTN